MRGLAAVRAAIDPPRPGGHAAFRICCYSKQVSARICRYLRPLVSKVTRLIIGYIELWTRIPNFTVHFPSKSDCTHGPATANIRSSMSCSRYLYVKLIQGTESVPMYPPENGSAYLGVKSTSAAWFEGGGIVGEIALGHYLLAERLTAQTNCNFLWTFLLVLPDHAPLAIR
jgi:hypothetical protein